MGSTTRVVQIVSAVVLLVSVALSGVLASSMTAEAGRAQLTYADEATEADPPEVAVGVALGAFRGMFVNYLWLRANRLKEEGKFYEAIELSNAITRLQPRFPRVWVFHAWNMAYNISVATNTASERWTWVRAGIDILRDEGIPRNPNELLLYKELAWIFNHKIQGFSDDANWLYKRELAQEWQIVLGEPPELPDLDTERAIELMVGWLQPIVDAPATIEGVIDAELSDLRASAEPDESFAPGDTSVSRLLGELESIGVELGEELLKLTAVSLAFRAAVESAAGEGVAAEQLRASMRRDLRERSLLNAELDALLDDPAYADAWERLLPFVRKRVLMDEYNMSPARMQRYTEVFGPMDWRHPSSHAIYWSAVGVDRALGRMSTTNFNTLNTDRMVVQALQELFRSGDVHYDILAEEGSFFTMYNLHFADRYGAVLETLAERAGRSQDRSQRIYTTYGQGYMNFVANVARIMYQLGQYEEAERYFRIYRTSEWINLNDYYVDAYASMTLDEFVADLITREDRLSIPHVADSEVTTALRMALVKGLLEGDTEVFQSNMRYAEAVHARYFDEQDITTLVDAETNRMEEMPANFASTLGQVFFQMLTSGDLNPLDEAPLLYERAPLFLRQLVYDRLRRTMASRGYTEATFNELYPEPVNMEGFRELMRRTIAEYESDRKAVINFETQ